MQLKSFLIASNIRVLWSFWYQLIEVAQSQVRIFFIQGDLQSFSLPFFAFLSLKARGIVESFLLSYSLAVF